MKDGVMEKSRQWQREKVLGALRPQLYSHAARRRTSSHVEVMLCFFLSLGGQGDAPGRVKFGEHSSKSYRDLQPWAVSQAGLLADLQLAELALVAVHEDMQDRAFLKGPASSGARW